MKFYWLDNYIKFLELISDMQQLDIKRKPSQKNGERRKEAAIAVSLMQETYHRIKSEEERKHGLIIILAVYGSTENISNLNPDQFDSQSDILDVTVQLQCLVKDS
ncbi:hypothetical protein CEXT_16341 [Caerostris extrusa]|uniref:DnaJ-like protein C11 C-terminal domain-containing protein n=1 Tax=Caerostris extrusa TaxID=172846 RepID=A0AAV4MAQ7_CAEEX|nr:hypothetical protein CEXT_16341 [Caerostris extrusa]